MKRIAIVALVLAGALAVGCGWPRTSQERAEWFFGYGEDRILDALDDVEAEDAQMDAAREVLAAHELEVTRGLEFLFERHRELLRALASGAGPDELLAREAELSQAHRETLGSIGTMHEAIGDTVGERTWAAARADMETRISERLDED